MNTKHFKQLLTAKKQDLEAGITRLESGVRESAGTEVGDEVDRITSSQGKSDQFQLSAMDYATLTQVDEALERIAGDSYGKCLKCGQDIEPARLEAVPWASYCIQDQEHLEKQAGDTPPPTL
jgi:DnaK suppressor protein